MSVGCEVSGYRPSVWRDDEGWTADQCVFCRKCNAVWSDELAEGVTWVEAMRAALTRERLDTTAADTPPPSLEVGRAVVVVGPQAPRPPRTLQPRRLPLSGRPPAVASRVGAIDRALCTGSATRPYSE